MRQKERVSFSEDFHRRRRILSLSLSLRRATPSSPPFSLYYFSLPSSPYQPRQPLPSDGQRRQHLQRERLRLHGVLLRRGTGAVSTLLAQQQQVGGAAARGLADAQRRAEGGVEGGGVEVGPAEELGVAAEGSVFLELGGGGERERERKSMRERVLRASRRRENKRKRKMKTRPFFFSDSRGHLRRRDVLLRVVSQRGDPVDGREGRLLGA